MEDFKNFLLLEDWDSHSTGLWPSILLMNFRITHLVLLMDIGIGGDKNPFKFENVVKSEWLWDLPRTGRLEVRFSRFYSLVLSSKLKGFEVNLKVWNHVGSGDVNIIKCT